MGTVQKAVDTRTGAFVAVKRFKAGSFDNEVIETSYEREVAALRQLEHPNIAKLLDVGEHLKDARLLVLEWLEYDVADSIKNRPYKNWRDFFQALGLPILRALSYAHERKIIHRDITPSNIMFTKAGVPKLIDFGIAKIKKWLHTGKTLRDFYTEPFAPPEADEGLYHRDVFSFGALLLYCLTNGAVNEYVDLPKSLKAADLPSQLRDLVGACVSNDPLERPHNCCVLLAQAERIVAENTKVPAQRNFCTIWVPRAKQELSIDQTSATSFRESLLLLEEDLANPAIAEAANMGPGHFFLYGSEYSCHVRRDESSRDQLVLCGLRNLDPSEIDRRRRRALEIPVHFRVSDRPIASGGDEMIDFIVSSLDAHIMSNKEKDLVEREWRRFQLWGSTLSALSELERLRSPDIAYNFVDIHGRRVTFHLAGSLEEPTTFAGQERFVRLKDHSALLGSISSATADRIVFQASQGNPDQLPQKGVIRFNSRAAVAANHRQRRALDSIQFNSCPRSSWSKLLAHPENAADPIIGGELEFHQDDLDHPKRVAVKTALGTKDFLLVEGPPGTGKTKFIVELILQQMKGKPESKILLTSQTHVALDNALERLLKLDRYAFSILRVATDDTRVSKDIVRLLPSSQLEQWRSSVIERSEKFLAEWAAKNLLSLEETRLALVLDQLCKVRRLSAERQRELDIVLSSKPAEGLEEITAETSSPGLDWSFELTRITELSEAVKKREVELVETLKNTGPDGNELASWPQPDQEAYLEELLAKTESKQLTKLLEIHAEWHARFGRSEDFNSSLVARSRVVAGTCVGLPSVAGFEDSSFDLCIVDEASKATATEVLIPLCRAHRCVIVGDAKQLPPLQDELCRNKELMQRYGLNEEEVRLTLFDVLAETLPESCRTKLTVQHRMAPGIGTLISKCFYDGELTNGPGCFSTLEAYFGRTVVWLTTSRLANPSELNAGTTYSNPTEARAIRTTLDELNSHCNAHGIHRSICVLSGYSGQVSFLNQCFANRIQEWGNLSVEVNSVDAFQGREADVCIYSLTRSNASGKMGFLNAPERANVALSRGREALLIFGDHTFARKQAPENPFHKVLSHVESHRQDCLLKELNNHARPLG